MWTDGAMHATMSSDTHCACQKESDKGHCSTRLAWRTCAVLISRCVSHFDAIPENALSRKAAQSKDCGIFTVKIRHIRRITVHLEEKRQSGFGKKRCNMPPTQIQRRTIKVRHKHIPYQKEAHKFKQIFASFFKRILYSNAAL